MNARRPGILSLAGLSLAALLATPAGAEERFVGTVTSVVGEATARQPDGEARALACGDPIYEGDRVATAKQGRVGVMMGDTLANLAEDSQLLVERTPAETPDVTLTRGKVRVIDPRQGGAPARLAALDASAELAGTDTEAYVFAEKIGPYAMLCEWDSPLVVVRPGERAVVSPGDCVISKKTEPLYTAKAHDERIRARWTRRCWPRSPAPPRITSRRPTSRRPGPRPRTRPASAVSTRRWATWRCASRATSPGPAARPRPASASSRSRSVG
jgi:hypothetical protein